MNSDKIRKFESTNRLTELNPVETLIKAGFKDYMVLCDIGAGTGIFSFPAAAISNNYIYALEVSDDMIEILESRIKDKNVTNLAVKKVQSKKLPLKDNSCDMVIMVTVLHEIKEQVGIVIEINRILKDSGRVIIIEFHKKDTLMGPPIGHRISEKHTESLFVNNGFKTYDKIVLGDNFYCVIFEKE